MMKGWVIETIEMMEYWGIGVMECWDYGLSGN